MEFFNLKSEARKVTACSLMYELPPEVIKSSREAILQAASEGKTFVNIEKLYPDVAGKLATLYRMLDFQTNVTMSGAFRGDNSIYYHVTIKWED